MTVDKDLKSNNNSKVKKIYIKRNNGFFQYPYSVIGTDGHTIDNYSTLLFAYLRLLKENRKVKK